MAACSLALLFSFASFFQAVLRDIWKGKVTSSEVSDYSFRGKDGGSIDDISGDKSCTYFSSSCEIVYLSLSDRSPLAYSRFWCCFK